MSSLNDREIVELLQLLSLEKCISYRTENPPKKASTPSKQGLNDIILVHKYKPFHKRS